MQHWRDFKLTNRHSITHIYGRAIDCYLCTVAEKTSQDIEYYSGDNFLSAFVNHPIHQKQAYIDHQTQKGL